MFWYMSIKFLWSKKKKKNVLNDFSINKKRPTWIMFKIEEMHKTGLHNVNAINTIVEKLAFNPEVSIRNIL